MKKIDILLRMLGNRFCRIPKRIANANRLHKMLTGRNKKMYFHGRSNKWTRWKK